MKIWLRKSGKSLTSPLGFILILVVLAVLADLTPHFINAPAPEVISDEVAASIAPRPAEISPALETTTVTRVIDGDTIVVAGNRTVRLIGMDTPEVVDPRKPVQCFGREASNFTKSLLPAGTSVELEKDVTETDKYNRLLRFVFKGNIFVDQLLVAQGYAHVLTIPPDVKYQQLFLAAEQDARINNRGLWKTCGN